MDSQQGGHIQFNDKHRQVTVFQRNTDEAPTGLQCHKKNLEIVFDKDWMETCINSSPRQFQDQLQRLVEKTIHSKESFFKRISYFFNVLVSFTKEQSFLLNWNIFEILGRGRMKSAGFRLLFKQQHLLRVVQDSQSHKAVSQKCVTSVRNVLQTHYRLYKAEGLWESQAQQQDAYLQQFEAALSDLSLVTKESHFLIQTAIINRILHDFMKAVYRNQFVLIVTNLLEILRRTQPQKQFAKILQLWQQNISSSYQLSNWQPKMKQLHNMFFKLEVQQYFESDVENSKKPFQKHQQYKNSKQISLMSKKTDKNTSICELYSSFLSQPLQSVKSYIKFYETKCEISETNRILKNFVKYIEVDKTNKEKILDYKLQAKVKQNQMQVLRYLHQSKRNYVFKFDITLDKHPENNEFQREKSQIGNDMCFQFRSNKANLKQSKPVDINLQDKITVRDMWAYHDRSLIYHFLLSLASSIQELEKHFIHHVDFSYGNFIKSYKIFQMIDFDRAYVVDKNNKQFRQINREIFDIWLQSAQSRSIDHLIISEIKYSQNKRYMWERAITKQEAINKCMSTMYQNMKANHYHQFSKLCRDLITHDCLKYQGFPLAADEVQYILQQIPQNPIDLSRFYENFIQNLKDIYDRYSPTRQVVGESQYPLFEQLNEIKHPEISQETMQKTIRFVHQFQGQPLRNILQIDQTINEQQDMILICRRNHTQFGLNHLYQKQKNLMIFLISCILTLEELEKNGILVLNLGIQTFVRIEERFFLKNFTYLFKISPKYPKVKFLTSQQTQLNRISIQLLIKISILETSGLRNKLFDIDTLKGLYQIMFLEKSQMETQDKTKLQRIKLFFQRNIKEIHFTQFKQLALSLLRNAPKCFQNTQILKALVKQKNLNNFYDLLQEIQKLDIVATY